MGSLGMMAAYDAFAEENAAQHAEVFALADTLLSSAQGLLAGPISMDRRVLLLTLLYARVVSNVHGAIVLLRMGRDIEADCLSRSALEAGFRLGALCRNPELIFDYLMEGPAVRQRAMADLSKLLEAGASLQEGITEESIAAVIRDADRERQSLLVEFGKQKAPKREVWAWARDAGQLDLYRLRYLTLSEALHHGVRDLERSLVLGDKGSLVALRFVPDNSLVVDEAIADVMVVLAHAVNEYGTAMDLDTSVFQGAYETVKKIHAAAAVRTQPNFDSR